MGILRGRFGAFEISLVVLGLGCQALDAPEHEPAENTIKIGLIERRNPRISAFAARLAADEINQAGGVLGKKLEIVVANDRLCDPGHSPSVVESLLRQGAVAIVAALCSSAMQRDLEAVAAPAKRDVVIVSPSSSSPVLSGVANFFRVIPSDAVQGPALANMVYGQGLTSAAVIHINNIYGNSLTDEFEKRFIGLGGRLTAKVDYPAGKTLDFRFEVESLFTPGKPAAVVIVGLVVDAAAITRDIATFGKPGGVRFFSSEATFGRTFLLNADISVAEGMQGLFPAPDTGSIEYRQFVEAYSNVLVNQSGVELDDLELVGRAPRFYDAVYLLALAMIRGGGVSTAIIRDNLEAVSGTAAAAGAKISAREFANGVSFLENGTEINYEGASGPIDFNSDGDPTRGAYLLWQIRNRQYVIERVIPFP